MAEIDLVVYGATGFTGGLVAEYLASTLSPGTIRWALAGRNLEKLEQVRARLTTINADWRELPLITADAQDPQSLHELTSRTAVILSTVGPFERYGHPLVEACVKSRTHYVDITGEPTFWKKIIERFHEEARAAEVLIVPCCGFDSIPFDMGAWYTLQALGPVEEARIRGYIAIHAKASGGTWASLVDALGQAGAGVGTGSKDSSHHRPRPHYNRNMSRFAVPLPTIDPMVVRRTSRLRSDYPQQFSYEHYLQSRSPVKLALQGLGALAMVGLAQLPSTRQWLIDLKPSGSGPSEDERRDSRFRVTFFAESGNKQVTTAVSGHDPGYEHTSKMVAQAALTIVQDRDRLPHRGGVLTPASAMAEQLFPRLQSTGMHFEILSQI